MRVAAVAFVMIVGAAIVLAFANTLNSWVLGGLLGGLAAILLCIPISLAIFAFLTRRHESRRLAAAQEAEDEMDFVDEDEGELMVYEDEERILYAEENQYPNPRTRYPQPGRRVPVSGYLPLPPVEQEMDPYEDSDSEALRRDPRNYPRQPRAPARDLNPETGASPSPTTGATRRPATRSLAQHQSAALRRARQEAQQQQRQARKRGASDALVRRSSGDRSAMPRPRTSHSLPPRERASDPYQPGSEYDARRSQQQPPRSAWFEEEDFSETYSTEELRERYQQYPRRPAYPRQPRGSHQRAGDPWTGELDGEAEQDERPRSRRSRRDPERLSGSMRNPLVRRAPYLYEDDPLNAEFARQLDTEHPVTRRSSLYEQYRDDEED